MKSYLDPILTRTKLIQLNLCRYGWVPLLLLAFIGCAQAPTKVYTYQEIDTSFLQRSLKNPIAIDANTVIIDARKPFDFAMAHYQQAVNLAWTDFTDSSGPFPGRLKVDLTDIVRRLALLGVSRDTNVVVVGYGLNGNGEEGRLAWTLLYMGLKKVQVSDADALGLRFSNLVPPPRPNEKKWDPVELKSALATREEVIHSLTGGGSKKIFVPMKNNSQVRIIDVRSQEEYFLKNKKLQYEFPNLNAVNIEWKEFYTIKGRPNPEIIDRLRAIKIDPNDRILVISNNGLRSGAVTYALLSLGFRRAANFAGGYQELLGKKSRH